jgi:IS5 family transposase
MFIASSASVTCSSRIRYKAHKLIRKWDVTNAAVHDSQKLDDVLDLSNTGKEVWADSAYRSLATEALAGEGLEAP